MPRADDPVLEVEDLRVEIPGSLGPRMLLDGVSFSVPRGRTLAMVGESGSGKTLTAHALLRLIAPPSRVTGGRIRLRPARGGDIEISALAENSELLYEVRGGLVSMVFQEPMSALSPVHNVGEQVAEAIWTHRRITGKEARRRAREMFATVGLPPEAFDRYPHELSGGMRQRVLIASALMCGPELVIADEPTTALDVTLQRQILDLLRRLQDEIGCSLLLITHDLAVVAQAADEVAVMSAGRIVEQGDVRSVLRSPSHAATRGLLRNWSQAFGPEISVADRAPTDPAAPPPAPLIEVRGLGKRFHPAERPWRRPSEGFVAVDNVSFDLLPGETLALVGESGAGKTTTARCLLRAVRPTFGSIRFRLPGGAVVDLASLPERGLKPVRRHAQMIFQDPFAALNPRMTVGQIVSEPLVIHGFAAGPERDEQVAAMLRRVGLKPEDRSRYPHAFSGGQRQRIVIARALILRPSFVVCDEATSGLDASVRRQILDLLKELQRELGLTYLFIAHQLGVVRSFCDRVAVMQGGRLVEVAPVAQLFSAPKHEHTRLLLSAGSMLEPQAPIPFPAENRPKNPFWAAG